MSLFYLIPAFIIGAALGYLLCALLVIAKQADRIAKQAEQLANKIDRRNSHEP